MPKIFYTERDIEDLYARGVTSLVVTDDVVVTDLGREQARKLGLELKREKDGDTPASGPVRPYVAKPVKSTAPVMAASAPPATAADMEQRVYQAVVAKVGDNVDAKLLQTIIRRVLRSVGGK